MACFFSRVDEALNKKLQLEALPLVSVCEECRNVLSGSDADSYDILE